MSISIDFDGDVTVDIDMDVTIVMILLSVSSLAGQGHVSFAANARTVTLMKSPVCGAGGRCGGTGVGGRKGAVHVCMPAGRTVSPARR